MNSKLCLACGGKFVQRDELPRHGLHERCFLKAFGLPRWEDFQQVVMKHLGSKDPHATPHTDGVLANPMESVSAFHGRFRKYSASLGGQRYILKAKDQQLAPELPDVEFTCNQIAVALGLPVPWFALIDFYESRAFITRNFVAGAAPPCDFVRISQFLPPNQMRYSCEELLSIITHESEFPPDAETFVHMCLFDALIGNHDRRGESIGILSSQKAKRLAPIFDNASCLGLETGANLNARTDPRGRITTASARQPGIADYAEEFVRLGHGESVRKFEQRAKPDALAAIVNRSTCSKPMKSAFNCLLHSRCKQLREKMVDIARNLPSAS